MRALWTGTLSFGLVNIPVRLYSASQERSLDFKLLDRHNLAPITYQKVRREDNKTVGKRDLVRGYKIGGRYVVLQPNDLKRADLRKAQTIDIVQFSDLDHIKPELYNKPYYLEPQKKFAKAYELLRDAMQKSRRAGIARFVLRGKEHIGALIPHGKALMLEQLRYPDEIKSTRDLFIPQHAEYSEKELEFALALIDSKTKPFDLHNFRDEYTIALRRLIAEKARGKKTPPQQSTEPMQASDLSELLDLLRRSIETSGAKNK